MRENDDEIPRLSPKEYAAMRLLVPSGKKGMYGLELVDKSEGQLGRGTVYVVLSRLEERGLVQSRQEEKAPGVSGIPRRLYTVTGYGARVFGYYERLQALRRPVFAGGLA